MPVKPSRVPTPRWRLFPRPGGGNVVRLGFGGDGGRLRLGGPPAETCRLGLAGVERARPAGPASSAPPGREITRRGRQKPSLRIVRHLSTALGERTGVIAHRSAALQRVHLRLTDSAEDQQRLADTWRAE